MELAEQQIIDNKMRIISLLRSTNRKGIENVIKYMDEVGFFTAPSSITHHHNWLGGLAQHSLGVYDQAVRINNGITNSSIILSALLHDICKGKQFYINEKGNLCERRLHIKGHGGRSCKLLKIQGLELSSTEYRAIRWHMGGHHAKLEELEDLQTAKNEKLYKIIHEADHLDARLGGRN